MDRPSNPSQPRGEADFGPWITPPGQSAGGRAGGVGGQTGRVGPIQLDESACDDGDRQITRRARHCLIALGAMIAVAGAVALYDWHNRSAASAYAPLHKAKLGYNMQHKLFCEMLEQQIELASNGSTFGQYVVDRTSEAQGQVLAPAVRDMLADVLQDNSNRMDADWTNAINSGAELIARECGYADLSQERAWQELFESDVVGESIRRRAAVHDLWVAKCQIYPPFKLDKFRSVPGVQFAASRGVTILALLAAAGVWLGWAQTLRARRPALMIEGGLSIKLCSLLSVGALGVLCWSAYLQLSAGEPDQIVRSLSWSVGANIALAVLGALALLTVLRASSEPAPY